MEARHGPCARKCTRVANRKKTQVTRRVGTEKETVIVIVRIWHGYDRPENADSYESLLKPEVLPGISKLQGYRGTYFARRDVGPEVEFVTIMLWESIDAVKAFAGSNYDVAVVPEERRRFLSRWDQRSAHYEVISHP